MRVTKEKQIVDMEKRSDGAAGFARAFNRELKAGRTARGARRRIARSAKDPAVRAWAVGLQRSNARSVQPSE